MLYHVVMLPITLGDPNQQTTHIFAFFVSFHIFVVGQHGDFKFGTQIGHS